MASQQTQFKSREDYKQQKALDEARKLGQIPAMQDEDGKDINPHMPQYILNAPWYLNQQHPGLKHHLKYKEQLKTEITDWYQKGKRQDQIVTKFRKGACENCGAMTHSKKDCMERPRKLGAKYTGQDLQADEHIQDIALDYDAKRDRWNGYDKEQYQQVIDDYELLEQEKQNVIKENANQQQNEGDQDELKQGLFENNAPVANHDPRTKTTTRNLRIREDTAKYLYNLDVNSAYYDPKSRALRENPNLLLPIEKQVFRGDNYNRLNGQALALLEQEKFAWETVEKKNAELNTIGLPSMTEQLYKTIKERRSNQNTKQNSDLEQIYGSNDKHFSVADHSLILGQTDQYVEFTSEGKVKHNFAKPKVKSKYLEDVLNGNHITVWGSWWNKELGWGYACCHSNEKASKCIGERGFKIAIQKEFKIKKAKEEELKNLEKNLHAQEETSAAEEQQQQQTINKQVQLQQQLSNKQQSEIEQSNKQTEQLDNQQQQIQKEDQIINKNTQLKEQQREIKKKSISDGNDKSSSSSSSSESSDSSDSSDDNDDVSSISSSSSSSSSQSEKKKKKKKDKRKEKENKKEKDKQKKLQKQQKDSSKTKHQEQKLNEQQKSKIKLQKEEQMQIEKDERKRKYNSMQADVVVTEQEIEEYRKKQSRFEDPMRNMKDFDDKYNTVD